MLKLQFYKIIEMLKGCPFFNKIKYFWRYNVSCNQYVFVAAYTVYNK